MPYKHPPQAANLCKYRAHQAILLCVVIRTLLPITDFSYKTSIFNYQIKFVEFLQESHFIKIYDTFFS